MGVHVGDLIDHLIVGSTSALERVWPMPKRLATPLPDAQRPPATADPVVLVGGFANAPSGWATWERSLHADGFSNVHVFDLPSRGLGDMRESAQLLASYLDQVKAQTGANKLDVVGFSEGGLLTRMAVGELGRAKDVDRLIELATPNAGITFLKGTYEKFGGLRRRVDDWIPAYGQLLEGASILGEVAQGDAALRAAQGGADVPRYASIYSQSTDTMVKATSAKLDGALNIPIAPDQPGWGDPSHFTMYHTSDRAYAAARELLLDHPDSGAVAIGQSGKP